MSKTFLVWLLCFGWMPTVLACNTIVVLGDSISAAHGIDPSNGWVTLLQNTLQKHNPKMKVINASVGSDTTLDGLLKLPVVVKKHQPCTVVVELGGNDALRGLPITQIKTNLAKIITSLQEKKIRVVLIGLRIPPNYGPEYTQQFVEIYQELAKKFTVILVPQIMKDVGDKPELMQTDGIHPNMEGHKKMLDNVLKVYKFSTKTL